MKIYKQALKSSFVSPILSKAKNGEADRTPEDILAMVKAQAAPAHRLILFLQQSSVEWASSLWLNVVQEVDPNFQRTVRGEGGVFLRPSRNLEFVMESCSCV